MGRTVCDLPSIPGELDLPLLVDAAARARSTPLGIWAEPATLLGYEYRAMEKLFRITRKIVDGVELTAAEAHAWRERYCVDMRTRTLHGPRTITTSHRSIASGSGPRMSARRSAN